MARHIIAESLTSVVNGNTYIATSRLVSGDAEDVQNKSTVEGIDCKASFMMRRMDKRGLANDYNISVEMETREINGASTLLSCSSKTALEDEKQNELDSLDSNESD